MDDDGPVAAPSNPTAPAVAVAVLVDHRVAGSARGAGQAAAALADPTGLADGSDRSDRAAPADPRAVELVVVDVEAEGGRGRAMGAAVAGTTAPVVVFLDAAVASRAHTVVASLIGALGREPATGAGPAVGIAVGQPPAAVDDPEGPLPGGVPDLLLRPVTELLLPALDWLRQPLTAPLAVPRTMVERLTVADGPAGGLALILGVARARGPSAVVPVDLGEAWAVAHFPDDPATVAAAVLDTVLTAVLPAVTDVGPPEPPR
jgi:hypothetical protein